jgi:signal transduction histidine kinase/CheY-like chemotaxis protein/HPt (histidine-containing phosphotransfer) domain-containing protein
VIETARQSGDVIRTAGKATQFLQVFAVLLLVGLVFLFTEISWRYAALQDGVRENALWSVYQLDREARRLHETLHVTLVENDLSPPRLKTLTTRYDILYSRMNIIEKTAFDDRFKSDPFVAVRVAIIRKGVFDETKLFDRLAAGAAVDMSELEGADARLEHVVKNTEELLVYSNNTVNVQRADAREALMALQMKSAGLVILLVGCVVFLIFTFRKQLSSMRLAGLSLETVSNQLKEAVLAAEAGNRAKSQFMATMGHEIRTPLNAIMGTAELLELSKLPASVAPGVQTIRRSGQALLEIINEILDFAKIEHGRLDVEIRAVDVAATAMAAVDIMRDRATEHGNRVLLDMPSVLATPAVLSDPTRLRQVLLNLLSNAIKFTREGVVTLRLEEMPSSDGPPALRFEVSDTGIGIDDEGIAKLFQPFSQVDASISRRYGGTGLGLTICRQILDALGGTVGVESRKGEGSTFWFEIPAIAADPGLVETQTDHQLDLQPLPMLDILLVEDNLVNQQVAAGFLAHLGQKVSIASDGLEAVEMAARHAYDLILMDMQMPRLDGIEAARRIRSTEALGRSVPIIAMTANASDDDRRLCHEAGMTGFQSKPVTMPQLRAAVLSAARPGLVLVEPDVCAMPDPAFETRRSEITDALGKEAFDELLDSFFDDATMLLADLGAALAANDHRQANRLLHTLKGAASSVGFEAVADRSQRLRTTALDDQALNDLKETIAASRRHLAA